MGQRPQWTVNQLAQKKFPPYMKRKESLLYLQQEQNKSNIYRHSSLTF